MSQSEIILDMRLSFACSSACLILHLSRSFGTANERYLDAKTTSDLTAVLISRVSSFRLNECNTYLTQYRFIYVYRGGLRRALYFYILIFIKML